MECVMDNINYLETRWPKCRAIDLNQSPTILYFGCGTSINVALIRISSSAKE